MFTVGIPAFAGAMHKLAREGDLAAIAALIEAGVEVNETDGEGETALHKAAKAGHADVVTKLLAAGADPFIRGKGPCGSTGTLLHLAAKFGHVDCLRVFLEAGIDPNLNDPGVGPPLHLATRYRREAAVEMFKTYGAGAIAATPIGALIARADPEAGKKIAITCEACHHL